MEALVTVVAVVFGDDLSVAAVGEEDGGEELVETVATPAGFAGAEGEEKKEVIEALTFGFLVVLVAMSAVLRFNGVAITVPTKLSSTE